MAHECTREQQQQHGLAYVTQTERVLNLDARRVNVAHQGQHRGRSLCLQLPCCAIPGGEQSIVMSMLVCFFVCVSVCLSVCENAYHWNYTSESSPDFPCILPAAVARLPLAAFVIFWFRPGRFVLA